MKNIKKGLLCLLLAAVCFVLSGCNILSTGEELLSPPMPGGELSEIRAALDSIVNEDYTLKYPTHGEYRSAIVRYDVTGNGKKDAVAFFSTEKENISSMHIALLTQQDDEWLAVKDVSVLASGIERVQFDDLNGDGVSEIIAGWSVYGSVDKQVAVYTYDGELLTPRLQEPYTEFLVCDLNTDAKKEILLLHLKSTDKRGTAKLLELTEEGVSEISATDLDGNATAVVSASETKLLDGRPAVFLDMQKGIKMITEILFLSGGKLQNPMYDKEKKVTTVTERNSSVLSQDINGDGTPDIPMLEVLPDYREKSDEEKLYITHWCSFDGKKLVVTLSAYMNYTDGYYFKVPKSHEGKLTVVRNTSSRTRTFYYYDSKEQKRGVELFKIMAVSENNWVASLKDSGDWEEVATANSVVYAVQKSAYDGENALKLDAIKAAIKITEEE